MNSKGLGLDIGATSIKLAMLDGKKGAFVLKAASVSPVPVRGMMSESPLDEEEMAQALAKAVRDAGIDTKLVNVALPENQVYTKVLEMPVLSDRELASAIYWEAEQYIPVPLTSITLVWNVLKRPATPAQGDKMEVLMVGAPTMLVNKYQKIISMAGFQINSMETEILAAIRSLVLDESFPTSLVVNIGAISTSFAIVRAGAMVFTYSMSIGGAAINRAIATDFGLTPQQAEEYKRVYGISGKNLGGKIGKATEPILNTILGEIKKSIAFYSQKYKDDSPIRQIILSGGTAKLPGIEIFFANNSGIETAIANPWKALASQQIPKEILDNASDYTIAVGLAMKDYE
jgi:type IV pilus assembly protein PilM